MINMGIFKNAIKNVKKIVDDEREKNKHINKGKALFLSNKKLDDNEPELVKEGYYRAMKEKAMKEKEAKAQEEELKRLKMQNKIDAQKLKNKKIKDKLNPKGDDDSGWGL